MSFQPADNPDCADENGSVALRIVPHEKDLGEFTVRRVLPAPRRRMVGPFIFFDHMGPAEFPPGKGIQVRPHPHIGIATITYLFEGEIVHRDSLGYEQLIRPGAVNLMTAGRGIVHSERAGPDLDETSRLHGIQSWMALPDGKEEIDPEFRHYPSADLPEFTVDGVRLRLIIGKAFGHESPVATTAQMIYLSAELAAGRTLQLPAGNDELAVYVVSGECRIGNEVHPAGVMAVAASGQAPAVVATQDSLVMVIGGEHIGERHIWWNLVSSSRERIEQAKRDWTEGRFDSVPGDDEIIPLPD